MMPLRLGFGLGLFIGSLALGWWLHRRGRLSESQASQLVRFLVMGPSPVVLCLLFWRMDLRHWDPWLLPLLGLLISSSTQLPAALFAKRAKLSEPETGSFLTCAFFSNVGYLGAFTAFALYGEPAYGLCVLYMLYFTPAFYTWGFGTAARYGRGGTPSGFSTAFKEELRLYPFIGMLVGITLNLAHVPRPVPLEWLNQVLIPLDTALYLTAIGSQLSFESPRPWRLECLAMGGIKFLYSPLIAWALVSLFHVQGLTRMVILLEASTPVAVSPLVLPLLFGLDRKLANALWLWTTLLAIPWFLVLVPLLASF
ncbi:MAG: hypothetical protein HYY90_04365 [Candidatus Omnitrophica bacterium]|nr:hypothetical protein [Candidatus Omnitrophota bacterium]